jgi:hypothetical protein
MVSSEVIFSLDSVGRVLNICISYPNVTLYQFATRLDGGIIRGILEPVT